MKYGTRAHHLRVATASRVAMRTPVGAMNLNAEPVAEKGDAVLIEVAYSSGHDRQLTYLASTHAGPILRVTGSEVERPSPTPLEDAPPDDVDYINSWVDALERTHQQTAAMMSEVFS